MNTHRVLRRIPGIEVEVGSEVDASEWRTAPLLVEQRYLKPIDAVAEPDGQTQSQSFDDRVIAAVKNDIQRGGELSHVFVQSPASARAPRQSSNKS